MLLAMFAFETLKQRSSQPASNPSACSTAANNSWYTQALTRTRRDDIAHIVWIMAVSEIVAAYRLHSAQCAEIAQRSHDPEIRLALLTMAQSWLRLAEQAITNEGTVLVYETPDPVRHMGQPTAKKD